MTTAVAKSNPADDSQLLAHEGGETLVVANPKSGQRRARRRIGVVVQALADDGFHGVRIVVTRKAGHANAVARRVAEGVGPTVARIVVIGGDGTVNEVAHGLVSGGRTDIPVGLIPFGTGNLIAKQFGIPRRRPRAAAQVIARGEPRPVDVLRVTLHDGESRLVLGTAGIGFDARIATQFHATRKKWAPGLSWYAWLTLRTLWSWRSPFLRLTVDGEPVEDLARWAVICNTSTYGGPLRFVQAARPDDGVLDVVGFRHPPLKKLRSYFWSLVIRGDITANPNAFHRQVRERLVIEPVPDPKGNGEPAMDVPMQLDGDPFGSLATGKPVTVVFETGKQLAVIAPPVRGRTPSVKSV